MPMEPPKIKDIFLAALEIPGAVERQAYVDSACGTDAELLNCVRDMLIAHQKALTPIPEGPTQAETTPQLPVVAAFPPGTIIDQRYKIIELIAEGGMGSVYRACRVSDMRMEVAIKLVKPGMASQQIMSRFNIERQALAIMKHENIAKVFDAGSTSEGYPYFVMELVKGLPITKFCDDNKFTVHQRLELFEKVCSAVQHAHQKGIVHRDLKPSNILVGLYDDKAVPKVIDFGLAKALHQPITDDILHTKFGTFVGTWQYTAPEQAILNNLDIDTRADIYSLGVILYELLTGNPPIEKSRITHAVMEEVLRIIREEEPPKPSTKIHSSEQLPSIAAMRRCEPVQLEREIRGELDWIVMRALEKDRNRRFATANEFGSDIRRYLAGEAVLSGPVTWQYRLKKFVHKNRGVVLAASLILAAISIGAIVSTIGWVTAHREQVRADQNAEIAQAVNDFLREDLLSEADPSVQIKPDQKFVSNITVVKALDRAAARVSTRFKGKPLVEAAIQQTIGKTYLGLGEVQKSRIHLERAEQLYRENKGENSPERLGALHEVGRVLLHLSKFPQSLEVMKDVVARRERVLGKEHQDSLRSQYLVALILIYDNKATEAKRIFETTLAAQRRTLSQNHLDTLFTQRELASTNIDLGDIVTATDQLEDILKTMPTLLASEHPEVLVTKSNLAYARHVAKEYNTSEALFREIIEVAKRTLGATHPLSLQYHYNLASSLATQGRLNDAVEILSWLAPLFKEAIGTSSYEAIIAMHCLAECYSELGKHKEAERAILDAYICCKDTLGPKNDKTIYILQKLISICKRAKNGSMSEKYQKILDDLVNAS